MSHHVNHFKTFTVSASAADSICTCDHGNHFKTFTLSTSAADSICTCHIMEIISKLSRCLRRQLTASAHVTSCKSFQNFHAAPASAADSICTCHIMEIISKLSSCPRRQLRSTHVTSLKIIHKPSRLYTPRRLRLYTPCLSLDCAYTRSVQMSRNAACLATARVTVRNTHTHK